MHFQPESVPLQSGNMYHPNAGQTTMVQHTTVQVTREMPRDHIIWSIFMMFYCGNPFCLGLAALIHSIKARDRKVVGDIEGARSHGSTARTLNIISTVIFCLSILITVIVVSVIASQVSHATSSYNYGSSYGDSYGRG